VIEGQPRGHRSETGVPYGPAVTNPLAAILRSLGNGGAVANVEAALSVRGQEDAAVTRLIASLTRHDQLGFDRAQPAA
jgi:hypothetical protein